MLSARRRSEQAGCDERGKRADDRPFITLERLERKGLVSSRDGDPTAVRGGRAKRFFRATPAGIAAANEAIHLMQSLTAGLETVLEC